jgi:hypothetical protein
MYRGGTRACFYRSDFQFKNFLYAIFIVKKKRPLYVNFSIPLVEIDDFLKFHTSCGYEIL